MKHAPFGEPCCVRCDALLDQLAAEREREESEEEDEGEDGDET